MHFTGALVQNLLRFYQDDQILLFIFEEFNSEFKQALSSKEVLRPFFPLGDQENVANLDSLALEFILTYQQEFDPFADLEEEYLLAGLEKLINEYEAVLSESEGEKRLTYFEKMPFEITQKRGLDLKNKAQFLLNKVRSEIENTFSQEKYIQSSKSLSSLVMGGNLHLIEHSHFQADNPNHPDEIKLREFLISEYHAPTNRGLETMLSCFVEQKSKRLAVSLYTAILLSVVYTNYSKRIGEIEIEALEKIIDISRVIPFPTATGLQILNYRFIMARALDIILNAEIENCKPLSAFNPQAQDFDLKTRVMNQDSLMFCARFLELYNSETFQIRTDVSKKFSLYFDQFNVLNKIFELLNPELNQSSKENFLLPS